jgi:branched-chain amino acid transport system ATP-binding protein
MSRHRLRIENLFVERAGRVILQDVSFELCPGEVMLLIGHNGSGKSTLLQAIAGLLPVRSGSIVGQQGPVGEQPFAFLGQDPGIFLELTVGQNIFAGASGQLRVGSKSAGIKSAVATEFSEVGEKWDARCSRLSGGMRRLVGFARTINTPTSLFLFDEPTAGLAPPVVDRCLDGIRSRTAGNSASAILVEHGPAAARIATRLCILRGGVLTYDGSPDLLEDKARLRELYL